MRPSRDRKSAHLLRFPLSVMPGLVPGISIGAIAAAEMDARNESGHDGGGMMRGGPWRRARALRPASPPVRGEGRSRSCVPPSRQRAVQGCPCFARVSRGCACAGAGGRIAAARLARLIARARRRAHLARRFPPGSFSRPPAVAFCRKAERRPRKPPLSTFILHHTAKCQAHTGTENETAGDFSSDASGMEARIDALRPALSPSCPFLVMPLLVMPGTSPSMTEGGIGRGQGRREAHRP